MIAKLIELNKKIAEMKFKNLYLKLKGKNEINIDDLEKELNSIKNQIGWYVLPFRKKIEEYNKKINAFPIEEQIKALKEKKGEAYILLKERGKYVKSNLDNRYLIQELNNIIKKIQENEIKEVLKEQIEDGEIDIRLNMLEEEKVKKIFELLNKIGIACKIKEKWINKNEGEEFGKEKVELFGRQIWIKKEKARKIKELLEEYKKVSVEIQLKNVERQIKKENEEEFENLQKRFLEINRQINEIKNDL